jgi:hypothetical protein
MQDTQIVPTSSNYWTRKKEENKNSKKEIGHWQQLNIFMT